MTEPTPFSTHYIVCNRAEREERFSSPPVTTRCEWVTDHMQLQGVALGPHDAIRFGESARFLPEFDAILKKVRQLEDERAARRATQEAKALSYRELENRLVGSLVPGETAVWFKAKLHTFDSGDVVKGKFGEMTLRLDPLNFAQTTAIYRGWSCPKYVVLRDVEVPEESAEVES